jgi:hypothetical protein
MSIPTEIINEIASYAINKDEVYTESYNYNGTDLVEYQLIGRSLLSKHMINENYSFKYDKRGSVHMNVIMLKYTYEC